MKAAKAVAIAGVLLLAVSELIGLAAMTAIRIGEKGNFGW
jgi:hypothetical protein